MELRITVRKVEYPVIILYANALFIIQESYKDSWVAKPDLKMCERFPLWERCSLERLGEKWIRVSTNDQGSTGRLHLLKNL